MSSQRALAPDSSLGDSLRSIQAASEVSAEALLDVVAGCVRQAWFEERGWEPTVTASFGQPDGALLVAVGSQEAREQEPDAVIGAPAVAEVAALAMPLAELPPEVLRRVSRLTRARISRLVREVRERKLVGEAEEQRGQLVDAIVERLDQGIWYLRTGELQAVLAPMDQIPGERLRRGQHLKVVLMEARRAAGGEYLHVRASRTSPLLLRRLLEAEVPELAEGIVSVRAIAREAGERAKVAVESQRPEVDAKGALIGLRGVRIRTVVDQLAGERVDILEWAPDPAEFVARALAPAPVLTVKIDEESHRATVTVAAEVLSLAIGREGQNARLAARLTGWRIDIHAQDGPRSAASGEGGHA